MCARQRSQGPRRRRKRVAAPPSPPEGSRRTSQPVSASIKMGRTSVRQMLVTFQLCAGELRLSDRAACMLGRRWCAAGERAPLWPHERSGPPRELRPSVKFKCAPALVRSSRRAHTPYGQHVEVTTRAAVAPVLDAVRGFPAHQKSMARGGRRQHDSRHPRHEWCTSTKVTSRASGWHETMQARRYMALSTSGQSAVAKDHWCRLGARTWPISDASAGARARCGAQSPPHGWAPRRAQDW